MRDPMKLGALIHVLTEIQATLGDEASVWTESYDSVVDVKVDRNGKDVLIGVSYDGDPSEDEEETQ